MPIGLQRSYNRASHKTGGQIGRGGLFKNRNEQIADIRQTIRGNEYLISYYQDLINPDHPTASFQVYLRRIDKKAEAIKAERRELIRIFNNASNGAIPQLLKQNIELTKKLVKLRINTKAKVEAEARVWNNRINKAKSLREKLKDLERELKNEGFNINDLVDAL